MGGCSCSTRYTDYRVYLQESTRKMKNMVMFAQPEKSRPSVMVTSACLRGRHLALSITPPPIVWFSSSSILKYLARKYNLPEHWYPSDVQRQAKIDEYLGWHGTNLRRGVAGYLYNKVQTHSIVQHCDECMHISPRSTLPPSSLAVLQIQTS